MQPAIARTLIVLACVGAPAAQDTPEKRKAFQLTDPDAIPIPTDTDGRKMIAISIEEALRLARANNVDLGTARLGPQKVLQDLIVAKAFYDSEVYAGGGVRRVETPTTNTFRPESEQEIYDARAGWRTRFLTGMSADVNVTGARTNQDVDSTFSFPSKLFEAGLGLAITQPLLRSAWTDYGNAEIRKAQSARQGAERQLERAEQDTLLAVTQAYWELVFAREDYKVQYQAKELADRQLEITQARIDVKDLAPRDKVADEAEVARRKEGLIIAENEIRRREDELRALLFEDRSNEMWNWVIRPTSDFEPDLEFADALDWAKEAEAAIGTRPDLAVLRENVLISRQSLLVAETDLWPQLDLVGSYNSNAIRSDDVFDTAGDAFAFEFPGWGVRLEFSYPLGNRSAQAIRLRAELDLEEAQRRVYAQEIEVRRQVREAVRSLKTLAESTRASQESVRLGQSDWETAVAKERAGTLTKFDVMERNQQWSEARSRLNRNQISFRYAQAALAHARGSLGVKPPAEEEPKAGEPEKEKR